MKHFVQLLLLLAILVIIAVLVINTTGPKWTIKAPRVITTPTTSFDPGPLIMDAIQTNAKLETVAMVFANDQNVNKEWGLEVFGEGACREGITYLGYYTVTAGVDLQTIQLADIAVDKADSPTQTLVTITLPPAAILHVVQDTQRSRVVHSDVSIISQLCGTKLPEMVLEAQAQIENYARAAALQRNILQMAQERAGFELQKLLFKLGYPRVMIQYR